MGLEPQQPPASFKVLYQLSHHGSLAGWVQITRTHTHTHARTHTHTHTYKHTHRHTRTHTQTHTHTHTQGKGLNSPDMNTLDKIRIRSPRELENNALNLFLLQHIHVHTYEYIYTHVFKPHLRSLNQLILHKDQLCIPSNNNTHIAAIAPLPLTTHPRWWAELLTFGPKCTLPF